MEKVARITPARAGTTMSTKVITGKVRDHPRSRGNHLKRNALQRQRAGSPPLAREPLAETKMCCIVAGITPARAGTTYDQHKVAPREKDHPRSRGNHKTASRHVDALTGSPPLAREPPYGAGASRQTARITPARAGTTVKRSLKYALLLRP